MSPTYQDFLQLPNFLSSLYLFAFQALCSGKLSIASLVSHPLVFRPSRKPYLVLPWELQKYLIASYWFAPSQKQLPEPASMPWEVQCSH